MSISFPASYDCFANLLRCHLGARVLRAGWRSLPADTRLRAKDIASLCSVSCSMVFTSKFNIISQSMPLPSKVYKGSVDLAAKIALTEQ